MSTTATPSARPARPKPGPRSTRAAARYRALVIIALMAGACSGGSAAPDEPPGGLTDVTHQLEPTEQMRRAAAEQCQADPDLDIGYVRAVDPQTGDQLAEYEVDCGEVRDR